MKSGSNDEGLEGPPPVDGEGLTSIELVKSYTQLSPKIVHGLLQILENMDLQYNRLVDLKNKAENIAVPKKFSKTIQEQCQKCEDLAKDIHQKLQELLPQVSNHDVDAIMELGMMTKQLENCCLSENQVDAFLGENNGSLLRAVNLYKALYDGGICIVNNETLEDVKRETKRDADKAVVLFFSTSTTDIELYQKTVDLFLEMAKERDIQALAINVDDHPKILETEKIDGPNKIATIKRGDYNCYDLLGEKMKPETLNIATPQGKFYEKAAKFVDTVYAVFPCPGIECNKSEMLKWTCERCSGRLEYDLNGNFYCKCGSMPIEGYLFRCCQPEHGSENVLFNSDVRHSLNNLQKYEQRNILFLGETGVGKSTCINSTACYNTYSTLEEAKANDFLYLIPFELNVATNRGFIKIRHGTSENEVYKDGSSCTQHPVAHYFKMEKDTGCYNICIIDTPGIGDSRGIEQDKINMQNIMDFLKAEKFEKLHLVCILMDPSRSRLTTSFQFCFKELVVQFHRSILDNLVFCFTKGKLTRYKIEDTRVPLTVLLDEINRRLQKDLKIKEDVNAFIVDNAAYRYLAKIKNTTLEYRDLEEEKDSATDYIRSSSQIQQMIKKALHIRPHDVARSLEVNLARNIILKLSGPMSKLNEAVNRTVAEIDEDRESLRTCNMNEKQLLNELMKPIKLYKFRMEVKKSVMCKECSVLKEYTGEERRKFIEADPSYDKTDPFRIWEGITLKPDDYGNYKCEKHGMDFTPVNISKLFHREEYTEMEIDTTVQQQLNNAKDRAERIQILKHNRQKQLKELQRERDAISKAAAKFAVFLQHNTVIPYNDITEEYLKVCIEETEKSGRENKYIFLDRLRELLKNYQEEKKFIESQIKKGSDEHKDPISPAEIWKTLEELKQLKNYGPQICAALGILLKPTAKKQQTRRREQNNSANRATGENPSMLNAVYNYIYNLVNR